MNLFSHSMFLQFFAMAYCNDLLLDDLSHFPADAFIKHMFDLPFPIYQFIPTLLGWLKHQVCTRLIIYDTCGPGNRS